MYGGWTTNVGTLLRWTQDAVAWNGGINALVMGHFINTRTPHTGSALREKVTAYNEGARAEFGRQFLDLGGFLTSPAVWGYAGITPTAADRREAVLAVGIRTFWVAEGRLHLGVGAGITWGSDAGREWDETELKARRLLAVAAEEAR